MIVFHIVMAPKQRLVVIGSGWVGLYIAQYIDTKRYDTTIISPHQTSSYTPLLASAACGLFPFTCAEESIRVTNQNATFLRANATNIDFDARKVLCNSAFDKESPEFDVEYDTLVLCPGCENYGLTIDWPYTNRVQVRRILSTHPVSPNMPCS